ncbi:MAG: CHAT domain-containing protein [Leptolyngbya sp. BL-A-14]
MLPLATSLIVQKNPGGAEAIANSFSMLGHLLTQLPGEQRALNLEIAITAYNQSLKVYTREAYPSDWARTQANLATTYRERIRGEKTKNIEIAISAYGQALQILTYETYPTEWANVQSSLAAAYYERIQGKKAENLEKSISFCQQAFRVYTCDNFANGWARTHVYLANSCRERIQGVRAENLEQSIAAYEQALQVYTLERTPIDWAMTQSNLATAYGDRIKGDRWENLETAITYCQQCLQVFTSENFPFYWAQAQINLASIYLLRIKGDRPENLENAITCYQKALSVLTREDFPVQWAAIQTNLGTAYRLRVRGKESENLEQAMAAYAQVLEVHTQKAFPVEWARTQTSLASAYYERIRGSRSENLEQSIICCQQALQVRTFKDFPNEWATTQTILGSAYRERIQGDPVDNVEQAITCYQNALQVRTLEASPIQWASTQLRLANAYCKRIRGRRDQNLEQAATCYRNSLDIFRPDYLPDNCRGVARQLAALYTDAENWSDAKLIYQQALQASEILYQSCLLPGSKIAELEQTGNLHRQAAFVFAKVGDLQTAVLTLEQGRARSMSESLERDRANLDRLKQNAPSQYENYQSAVEQLRQIEDEERTLDSELGSRRQEITPEALRDRALQAHELITQAITQICQVTGYSDFLDQPSFGDIESEIAPDCPIVYLVSTSKGSLALIVTQNGINPLWFNDFTETTLQKLVKNWFTVYENYKQKQQAWTQVQKLHPVWQEFQTDQSREKEQAWLEIQNNHPVWKKLEKSHQDWLEIISTGTHQLWLSLMAPLLNHLQQHNFQQAALIPTGLLELFPLHAAWTNDPSTPTGQRYALDTITFTYAPNARSLTAARKISNRTPANSMLAIDNPTKDLLNSEREVQAAISYFPQHQVLFHNQATDDAVLTALPNYSVLHFSCHGYANLGNPLRSGLLMANQKFLTLNDFFKLKLRGIRLAILSACETGLSGTELPDEVISLPTGLLQAGVSGIVSSLWSVSELSTMVLLTRFYDLWRKDDLVPAAALREAQRWVRDTTSQQKAKYFKETNPDIFQALILLHPAYFSHPFHWAAFNYTGV